MGLLHIILPILVGAVIGYCTNYIAIKMLFHPHKEVYIGKWRLPFTPGIIPKNQSRLANAVGDAVSGQLLTKDAVMDSFRKSKAKENFVSEIASAICESNRKISELLPAGEANEEALEAVNDMISGMLMEKAENMDLKPIIAGIGKEAMEPFMNNPMIAMFLNEEMENAIYDKLGSAAKNYLQAHGEEIMKSFTADFISELKEKTVHEIVPYGEDKEKVASVISGLTDRLADRYGDSLLDQINVKDIVKERIEGMDVNELETLVLSVMKQELQAVINLGAVIGAVIGIINIFI